MDHVLVLREDGEGFDLGYSRAVKLPGGDVLAVYYYATGDGVRHIALTRRNQRPMKGLKRCLKRKKRWMICI